MKLQFKHQKFQEDAARAVVEVFAGQPCSAAEASNRKIIPALTDEIILEHIRKIQQTNQIKPSEKLEGRYHLTIEMETGVGKTYTYIKTIYELNKAYGWNKFIVVVPSVAIREGVYKTFQVTQEHFSEEYGKKIRFFIYDSARLTEIGHFADDRNLNVMIINSQAFNARGTDARRIYMKLDEFRSRRPIDMIAQTNPVLIIDEPQSAEGRQTKERLKEFCPLLTLRYSATHKSDSIYHMVYRLGALEAYHKKLVKKIAVKGISANGTTGTEGFVFLESIHVSGANPTATIRFDVKGKTGVRQVSRTVNEGCNLYEQSGNLEEYRNGYTVSGIDARDGHIRFLNGKKLFLGEILGNTNEEQIRRIQIHETILSHIERESQLFHRGIKVLSLFFIDEVAKYKQYDESGNPVNGIYADMFEEEYKAVTEKFQQESHDDDYKKYLDSISAESTHAGYFSVDRKGRLTDGKIADKKEKTSDDVSAYDLIMKNKELLLDCNPERSPVRFLFSHSALREGWDNPNVFQICTLKQSGSEVRKRQEVGRGLRLCVNQNGGRMDFNVLGDEFHHINVLTIIANESYDSFAKGLQREIHENQGNTAADTVQAENRIANGYLRHERLKTDAVPECKAIRKELTVAFDPEELVRNAIETLNSRLKISEIFYRVETGMIETISSGEKTGKNKSAAKTAIITANQSVKYDLIGRLVSETELTRKEIVRIMTGIAPAIFEQYRYNPEEFILRAAQLINIQKTAMLER